MTIEKIRDNFDKIPYCGCWLWKSGTTKGYGTVHFNGKLQYSHRVMWEDTYGPIPEGMHVLHKCDTPLCSRPDHMFLGTHADNMADCARKGRCNQGERNGCAKLKEQHVGEIRKLLEQGENQGQIAIDFGVSPQTVCDIKKGRIWSWLTETHDC